MKTFVSILALVVLFGGLWWWGEKNNMGKVAETLAEPEEFCFAKFQDSADSEFQDKYTMRLLVTGDKAQGTLRLLPAEKDGLYEYKDPAKVDYSFQLDTIACGELDERGAVEKYLWENIAKLSPTAPALGGNWYVVAATLDLEKNTGAVTYEDGHIQEKRNFSYVLSADGTVANMTIE